MTVLVAYADQAVMDRKEPDILNEFCKSGKYFVTVPRDPCYKPHTLMIVKGMLEMGFEHLI